MKRPLSLLFALALLAACTGAPQDLLDHVNVFNGTGYHGHTYPGATTPFGLVQLSPDTRVLGWDGCSGYHYSDTSILGFSHTHLSGTGCADLGDFLFTPGVGEVAPLPLDHKKESARPGYYKVETPSIVAELTATPHVGVHRYTFSGEGERLLLIDAVHTIGDWNRAREASLTVVSDQEVAGKRIVDGWVGGRECYLSASFSVPFEKAEETAPGKLLLSFPEGLLQLTVKAGLSFSSAEGALENRLAEAQERSFDELCLLTQDDWNSSLGTILVEGGPVEQFYTCLYHTLVCPNNIADAGAEPFYSTLSLWDTFRSWNPLQMLINPELVRSMVSSMLEMYRQWGELPIWPLAHGETGCMIGYHSIPVIADAHLRGIGGFDPEEALEAMIVSSNKNKGNTSELYTKYGYIPADMKGSSVSQTLEFAFDDWCIARVAESLGRLDVAAEYDERARSYQRVFDPVTGFMRGKNADGSWVAPFDQVSSTRDYTEAIPWQYRFFVPHDEAGHISLMGGAEAMEAALDSLFTYSARSENKTFSDITGLMGQYAHGNEPSHHMAYIYNWVGAPSKSQEVVRSLLKEMYDVTPEGVCGNEDCGQMSAWYVLSSLGLYPACPASGEFILSAPLFKKAAIGLGNGNALTITADHPQYPYIKEVTLNGKPVERNYLTYEEIMAGGTLSFTLSRKPCHGRDALPAPYSLSTEPVVSTPAVAGNLSLFRDRTQVEITSRTKDAAIHYTLDGSEPGLDSPLYEGPFVLEESARIRARAFREGMQPSPEASVQATRAHFREASNIKAPVKGCAYTYHRGDFKRVADVWRSPVVACGTLPVPSIEGAPDEDYYGYIFTGCIDIPEDGIWSFALNSDDGSTLEVDGTLVVDNDGTHSAITAYGRIPLLKGLHPYRLTYLESYEGNTLSWGWKAENAPDYEPVPPDKLCSR